MSQRKDAGGKKPRKSPGPFHSQAQWRWAFATHQPFAHKWAVRTTGTPAHGTPQGRAAYARLPRRKGAPTLRSAK
ncbi:hypothetical protein [Actinoallomurus sp. NPDC052274]|uniref:hypothetical protein n=1 Tax=Actinoallomurus sp. NPDC052274 TaxID=3155420 RepID=UPI00341EF14F